MSMVTTMEKTLLDCEQYIEEALAEHATAQCPPLLAQALNYAVFPGGARVRPQLCKAVALASNSSDGGLANAAATAVEFLHCASLVHDDLPCFDDATQRRGKPSVHAKFGERIAVLTGDALIVAAFQTLSAHAVQAIRAERAKTGALFVAATCAGAAAAGVDPGPWVNLGASIGEAYQVADDIKDAVSDPDALGKPTGIDVKLDRPSAVRELGLDGAVARLKECLEAGLDSMPACAGHDMLQKLVRAQASRFVPEKIAQVAA